MKDGERNTYADMGDDPAYAPTRQENADAGWRRYQRLCAEADAARAACVHVLEPVPHDSASSRCILCGRVTPRDVPEMEEVKPGKWACPAHEDVVVATRQPVCPECEEPTDV